MENTELIDKYLSGEMAEGEMINFEQTLSADPLLKKEFEFQESIVEGIKTVRMNELKASLNAIDVSGLTSTTSVWNVKTVAISAVVAISGIASLYFINNSTDVQTTPVIIEESKGDLTEDNNEATPLIDEATIESLSKEDKEIWRGNKVKSDVTASNELNIVNEEELESAISNSEVDADFGDFDEDSMNHSTAPDNHLISKGEFEHATIDVVVDNNKKKYSFHYQVKDNTLFLYGTFDEIYEVYEFKHGEKNDLFFLYDSKYYNIKENQSSIVPLEEMTEAETLDLKLKINSGNEAKSQ